jgi:hypothetical protein
VNGTGILGVVHARHKTTRRADVLQISVTPGESQRC